MRSYKRLLKSTAIAACTQVDLASAQVIGSWIGPSNGSWNVTSNWAGGIPNSPNAQAHFGTTSFNTTTVTLNAPIQLAAFSTDLANPSGRVWINAGTSSGAGFTFGAGGNGTIQLSRTGTVTFAAPIQLAGPLQISGSASLGTPVNVFMTRPVSGAASVSVSGLLTPASARVALEADNSNFTGTLVVNEFARVTALAATSLGSPSQPTIVKRGGELVLVNVTTEPLQIEGGVATLEAAAPYAASLDVSDGTLIFNAGLSSPVQVSGASTLRGSGTFNALVTGAANLQLQSNSSLFVNAVPQNTGSLNFAGSMVTFNNPLTFPHTQVTSSAQLRANAEVTFNRLEITGGSVLANPGGAIRSIDPELALRAGALGGTLTAVQRVVVHGGTLNSLPGYTGDVLVRGVLRLNGTEPFGTTAGVTRIDHPTAGVIQLNAQAYDEPFQLQNGKGSSATLQFDPAARAALFGVNAGSGTTTVLNGPLALGDQAARIGGALQLNGPVTGGGLEVAAGSRIRLESADNSYSGATIVNAGSFTVGTLSHIRQSSRIEVQEGAGVQFYGNVDSPADRIGDITDIGMRGGQFYISVAGALPRTERIGVIRVERSLNYFTALDNQGTVQAHSLVREPGTQISFQSGGKIFFDNPPELNDGILGGWTHSGPMTYNATDGLSFSVPSVTDLNSAGVHDNVATPEDLPIVLTASRTINSLYAKGPLDLNGHTLTIDTGAIHHFGVGTISNGVIRPGEGSRELFVSRFVGASIADGLLGPTDVIAEGTLGGVNTFTGTAIVNREALKLLSVHTIHPEASIRLVAGRLTLPYATEPFTENLRMKTLTISDNGMVVYPNNTPAPAIEAMNYVLESGTLGSSIAGTGTLVKQGEGVVRMVSSSPNFSGPIEVRQGFLIAAGNSTLTLQNAFGTGRITVFPGGFVSHINLTNPVTLAGGTLDSRNMFGALDVVSDSATTGNGLSTINIRGALTVQPGVTLTHASAAIILGDAHVDGSLVDSVGSFGSSNVSVRPESGRTLSGMGNINGEIVIAGGARLSPGTLEAAEELSAWRATFGAGGVYDWTLADAAAFSGSGWDQLDVGIRLAITATSANPFVVSIDLVNNQIPAQFDPSLQQSWRIVNSSDVMGFDPSAFVVDAAAFSQTLPPGATFHVQRSLDGIYVVYIPEPALAMSCFAAIAMLLNRHRAR